MACSFGILLLFCGQSRTIAGLVVRVNPGDKGLILVVRMRCKGLYGPVLMALGLLSGLTPVGALSRQETVTQASPTIALAELPVEGQQTYRLIFTGGPFAYEKDGSVFGNREQQLPRQARGYYREYTVRTPGSRDRGARRIVCGGFEPVRPETCYYTADHYANFRKIVGTKD